jgi:hypothetical protein
MPNALLCAETVAMMVLGEDLPDYFPRSYLITADRFQNAIDDASHSESGEDVKRVKL